MLLEKVGKFVNVLCKLRYENSRKMPLIPNSSRQIATFFYGKDFEVKWCQRWKNNIWNNKFPKKI